MRVLTYLDQHQLRLGYLNCLVLVAGRQLDSRGSLLRRFEDFIHKQVETVQATLFPEKANPKILPIHTGGKDQASGESQSLHVYWLNQSDAGDKTGAVARDRCYEILELARNMDLIGHTYALTELGVLLKGLLLTISKEFVDGRLDLNPFHLWKRRALVLLHLYALLSADIVIPFLVKELSESLVGEKENAENEDAETSTVNRIERSRQVIKHKSYSPLNESLDRLIRTIEGELPIEQTLLLKEVADLRARLQSTKALEHHFRPRRQFLKDLGLLESPFVPNIATRKAAECWHGLRDNPLKQDWLIERHFFRWSNEIYGFSAKPASDDLVRLDYFARGFPIVSREIGFTPARTVALAGCLLAIEEGTLIEIEEMFKMMKAMAKGPYRPYLFYSGGSRLDREFLIRVNVNPLRKKLQQTGMKGPGAKAHLE